MKLKFLYFVWVFFALKKREKKREKVKNEMKVGTIILYDYI